MFDKSPLSRLHLGPLGTKGLSRLVGKSAVRIFGALLLGAVLVLHRSWPIDARTFGGVAAMSLVAGLFVRFHLRHTSLPLERASVAERAIWATTMIAVLGVQVGHLALDAQSLVRVGFLMTAPLVAQAMLVSGVFGPSIGLVALTLTSLLLGFGGAMSADMTAAAWVAGAIGAHVVNPLKHRGDLTKALGVQIGAQAILAVCLTAVKTDSVWTVMESAVWAGLAAIAALSIFWLGIAVLERMFGIVSDWTLLELCSPEHPLLKDLCLRAPGTHVHSIGVANLAEGAARAIGANPVLSRTMAYFHDVGKLARPGYFSENQISENPHDELSPTLSAKIIVSHVKDGVEMARANKVPQIVLDGIQQHHGTSLVSFFYSRALDQGVSIEDRRLASFFRYDGPKPRSKEAAILHLADQVEAASRTIKRGDDLVEFVRGLVESSRSDGQLDECDLSFRELKTIESSFVASLTALRHERVHYPEQEVPTENDKDLDQEPVRKAPQL